MLMSRRLPGSRLLPMPSRPADQERGLQQIGIGGAVGEPQLEAAGIGNADHVRAVVAGIGDGVGRPGRARQRRRRVDALVGVHRRIGDGAQRLGRVHDAADEMIGHLATGRARPWRPRTGSCRSWSTTATRARGSRCRSGCGNGFGMKVARSPCFSAIDFTMYLKKACRSAVLQRGVVFPVHLELAVRVLVVVLVRASSRARSWRRRFRR